MLQFSSIALGSFSGSSFAAAKIFGNIAFCPAVEQDDCKKKRVHDQGSPHHHQTIRLLIFPFFCFTLSSLMSFTFASFPFSIVSSVFRIQKQPDRRRSGIRGIKVYSTSCLLEQLNGGCKKKSSAEGIVRFLKRCRNEKGRSNDRSRSGSVRV